MKTEVLSAEHPIALRHAVDVLNNGGTVAFPTDTVYGLAALPFERKSVDRLYVIKGRNSTRAIAVLLGDLSDLRRIAVSPSEAALRLADRFWPGPLTLIVPRNPDLPDILSKNLTIGVRIPDHPVALQLLRMAGPLAVTSANISGNTNTTTVQEVLEQLDGRVHLIIDGGRTPGGIPSTVVDCTQPGPVILRPGPISLADIQRALA
ncbi:MAG: L-threonylcarbamoyladenylate synthase [Anaerolineales bacterium]|jgi:L-threonylcarbamoyladenylate synthase